MGELYRLDFPNGKSYIGITSKTAQKRFSTHVDKSRRANYPVSNAIRKYGEDSVKVNTLVIADDWDYLCDLEIKAIKVYGTFSPLGYNLTKGGDGFLGGSHTDSTKEKLRKKSFEIWDRPGHRENHRARVKKSLSDPQMSKQRSASQRSKWLEADYRKQMVESHTGVKQSKETIAKRAKGVSKSWRSGERSHPNQKEDSEILEIYNMKDKATQKEVARKFNTSQPYVGGVWRHEKAKMALIRLGIMERD